MRKRNGHLSVVCFSLIDNKEIAGDDWFLIQFPFPMFFTLQLLLILNIGEHKYVLYICIFICVCVWILFTYRIHALNSCDCGRAEWMSVCVHVFTFVDLFSSLAENMLPTHQFAVMVIVVRPTHFALHVTKHMFKVVVCSLCCFASVCCWLLAIHCFYLCHHRSIAFATISKRLNTASKSVNKNICFTGREFCFVLSYCMCVCVCKFAAEWGEAVSV